MATLHKDIRRMAIQRYTAPVQIYQAVEELNELAVELMHWNKRCDNHARVVEEIGDCTIMIEQLADIFGIERVRTVVEQKYQRLEARLTNGGSLP